ncbi:Rpn family recombination-promoting nuclease/putative transposase [Treponema primitia]|uniref:Rpn family recombination-promoting nuclease/putative transposase n=1 Tax=Treponema primitia TaxID=88058 RepID=UPI0002554FD2|nr:Rpn family recombination-promoting nuclease/putative transposase [Treponema primitia]
MKLPFLFSFFDPDLRRQARKNARTGKALDLLSDFVFKALFTAHDEDSQTALRCLLSACIHRPVTSLSIRNSELLPEYLTGKTIRLDIHLVFNDGEQADIEIQVDRTNDDIKVRAVVYAAYLLSSQAKRGKFYKSVPRVYQIFFLNFILFPGSDKVPRRYTMREEDEHDELSEVVNVIFYELPKLKRIADGYFAGEIRLEDLPDDQKWGIYFRYRNDKRMAGLVEALCREEGIMNAERMLKKISRTEEQWARALFREKAAMDYRSEMYASREAGKEVGREEAEAKYKPILEENAQVIEELRRKLRDAGIDS